MSNLSLEKVNATTYRTHHDMNEHGLSLTITSALAEVEPEHPVEVIEDFTERIDPVALDRLFRSPGAAEPSTDPGQLQFEIHGIQVVVHSDGEIYLEP